MLNFAMPLCKFRPFFEFFLFILPLKIFNSAILVSDMKKEEAIYIKLNPMFICLRLVSAMAA